MFVCLFTKTDQHPRKLRFFSAFFFFLDICALTLLNRFFQNQDDSFLLEFFSFGKILILFFLKLTHKFPLDSGLMWKSSWTAFCAPWMSACGWSRVYEGFEPLVLSQFAHYAIQIICWETFDSYKAGDWRLIPTNLSTVYNETALDRNLPHTFIKQRLISHMGTKQDKTVGYKGFYKLCVKYQFSVLSRGLNTTCLRDSILILTQNSEAETF